MALETFTFISSLNSSNPVTGDQKTEGDDHIRGVKASLLATFPNITGAVTPIQGELNRLAGHSATAQGFYAARAGTDQTSGQAIVFDTEYYDHGGIYNVSTGVFTATATGDWLVSFTIGTFNASTSGTLAPRLIVNNSPGTFYIETVQTVPASSFGSVSWSGVLTLTLSTTLQLYNQLGTTIAASFPIAGGGRSSFSARLLV